MNEPICLFDSGIGGLTVLKKLLEKFPNEGYIYLADLANVPYGDKTKEAIEEIAKNNIEWLSKFNPKLIIMACNTSSTVLCEENRTTSVPTVPLYGMIQSLAKEISKSKYKKITVWATKLVIENNGYKNAINILNPDIKVEEIACPKLVPMIEGIDPNLTDKKRIIKEYLKQTSEDSQALILGCTHYPLIQEEISKLTDMKIVDPAEALVSEVQKSGSPEVLRSEHINLLTSRPQDLQTSGPVLKKITFYTTAQKEKVEKFANIYLCGNHKVNTVDLKKIIV